MTKSKKVYQQDYFLIFKIEKEFIKHPVEFSSLEKAKEDGEKMLEELTQKFKCVEFVGLAMCPKNIWMAYRDGELK